MSESIAEMVKRGAKELFFLAVEDEAQPIDKAIELFLAHELDRECLKALEARWGSRDRGISLAAKMAEVDTRRMFFSDGMFNIENAVRALGCCRSTR